MTSKIVNKIYVVYVTWFATGEYGQPSTSRIYINAENKESALNKFHKYRAALTIPSMLDKIDLSGIHELVIDIK